MPSPTPLQQCDLSRLPISDGIRLFIKRDDLLHPTISGNKWRKLEPVLKGFDPTKFKGIVSFGGPFSNHLEALAKAGNLFNIPIGAIVRGSSAKLDNPTLSVVRSEGAEIIRISKKSYDEGPGNPEYDAALMQFHGYLVLPEGGSTRDAAISCTAISEEIIQEQPTQDPLIIAVPVGSGATAAGVIEGLAGRGEVLCFPASASGVSMETVQRHLEKEWDNWRLIPDYDFGGFAAYDPKLVQFIEEFKQQNGILLDPIYTGKMVYGIYKMLQDGAFPSNACIVAIHTGGLQGWKGYRERWGGGRVLGIGC